jgi:hypothetical protein
MQTSLFEIDKPIKQYKAKSRGKIYTDKIWKELDVHSKINIKVAYGFGKDLSPDYLIINTVFKCGLDMYCLTNNQARHTGFMCFWDSSKKLIPI